MGAQTGVTEQPAVVEGGPDDVHVGEVAAAEIGIVVEEDVAVVHVRREHRDDGANRIGHRPQVDRQIRSLRHHRAISIEHAAGIIARRLQ